MNNNILVRRLAIYSSIIFLTSIILILGWVFISDSDVPGLEGGIILGFVRKIFLIMVFATPLIGTIDLFNKPRSKFTIGVAILSYIFLALAISHW